MISKIFNDKDALFFVEQMIEHVKANPTLRLAPLCLRLFDNLSIKTAIAFRKMLEKDSFVRKNIEIDCMEV